jgi:hypothetical protein
MPYYPSINPALLASLPQPQGAIPNMQAILQQQGMQAPAPAALPPPGIAPPQGPASASPDAMDARAEQAQALLGNMSPTERAAAMQAPAAGVQGALGNIEAPHKPVAPVRPQVASTDWPKPGEPGGATAPGGAPGGGSPATFKTTPAHDVSLISPETRGQLNAADAGESAAVDKMSAATTDANESKAAGLGGQAEQAAQDAADLQAKEADRTAKMSAQEADEAKLRAEYANAEKPKDSRGIASKLAGAIAAGLGAYGSGITKTPNYALEIINKSIDNDIQGQKDAIERKGKTADLKGNQLKALRERFGDERAAEAALRSLHSQRAILEGDQMVQKAQSPILAAQFDATKAQLQKQAVDEKMKTTQYMQSASVQTGGAAAGGASRSGVSDVKPDEVMTSPDGKLIAIPDQDARKEARGAMDKAAGVQAAGNELKRLVTMPFAQRMQHPIDWAHAYDAAKKTLMISEVEGGAGSRGKAVFEATGKAVGNRTLLWAPGQEAAVAELTNAANRSAAEHIARLQPRTVEPVDMPNPKTGIIERKHRITGTYAAPPPPVKATPAGSE